MGIDQPTMSLRNNKPNTFDSGAVTVNTDADWVFVGRIDAQGYSVFLQGTVGAGGPLGDLLITSASVFDDDHVDLATGSDFNTATTAIPATVGSSIATTAAGGVFQMRIDLGAAEYAVWAKNNGVDSTTLQITGTVG